VARLYKSLDYISLKLMGSPHELSLN